MKSIFIKIAAFFTKIATKTMSFCFKRRIKTEKSKKQTEEKITENSISQLS